MTDQPEPHKTDDTTTGGRRPVLRLTPAILDALRARYPEDDEEEAPGGDPACWAHLFEDEPDEPPS